MAWRCKRCGQVYEGDSSLQRRLTMGEFCPGQTRYSHEWKYFESAQDKQNKLLEQQNQLLAAQLMAQAEAKNRLSPEEERAAKKREEEKRKLEDKKFEQRWKAEIASEHTLCEHWGVNTEYPNMRLASFVNTHLDVIAPGYTAYDQQGRRADLAWILIRDLHLTKIETAFTLRSVYLGELNDLTRFYEVMHKEMIDQNIIFEVADAFAETDFFKENVNNPKKYKNASNLTYDYYEKVMFSFYPPKYCERLDEIMMKKDGKEKYNAFVRKFKFNRIRDRVFVFGLFALPVFLLSTCVSCLF